MITGIAWDHRRCWGPLDASVAPYARLTGEEVRWDRRSLYSFGEGDLGDYAAKYDLVIYDHPFVGDVARHGWMMDLRPHLSASLLAHFDTDSVGASWPSYFRDGGIWALPIDSAAQTAAWRQDLLDQLAHPVPQTLDEVRQLAETLAPRGMHVGWPFVPTDLMCTLVSLAASRGLRPGRDDDRFLDPSHAAAVIDTLKALARLVHPSSKDWNPIACLNHMSSNDDVVYAPYLFNYVNYSTTGPHRHITFGPPPAAFAGHAPRTILGGAGIGISARSENPEAALAYALWLCAPEYQSGDYVRFGGQPGSRSAWMSAACNRLTGNFFHNTLPALDAAYLRPTPPGFVPFFHDATLRLADVVLRNASAAEFVVWLNGAYARLLEHSPAP